MRTIDFDFELPEDLIAQFPAKERAASRLLCMDGGSGKISDNHFSNLPARMTANDLLILNDTRVIKARLFGEKDTGGKLEFLVERIIDDHTILAHIKSSRTPKPGSRVLIANSAEAEILRRQGDLFLLKLLCETPVLDLLELHGALPLPPYITHAATHDDESRYQTVYAREAGAVAAPTAGLHFDEVMLETLKNQGVQIAYITLHVGAGTFQPVRVDSIAEHKMHSERYTIPSSTIDAINACKKASGKVTAVGTTTLRALESAARVGNIQAGSGETDIFITPGFEFKVVERLLTNFHLPKSTLLMLVSAFAGYDNIMAAYHHAVKNRYRFFSYGDAMLLERR